MKKIGIIILTVVIALVTITSISASKPHPKKMIMINNGEEYTSLWKEVEKFDAKRLPKSALEQVNKIYTQAKADNNQEQIIKTLFYKAKYQQSLEEHSFIKAMAVFKMEAEKASFPNKQIIYSIIGEQFYQYYYNNQWQINQRTATQNYDLEDIETWDLKKIMEESAKYFLMSLENEEDLSRVSVKNYLNLITDGKDSEGKSTEKYRPNLYDFLAHRAIDFFSNDLYNITQAANTFKVDDEKYFEVAEKFAQHKIEVVDSSNLKNYAFILLQNLTKAHLNDTEKYALIDVELKRLKFTKENAQLENKDNLYYEALEKLSNNFSKHEAVADVYYEMANIHFQNGQKYNSKEGLKYKGEKEKAIRICYATSMNYGASLGAKKCLHLLDKLKEKQLTLRNEKYYPSNKKSKVSVNYKNIKKSYFKIIKVDYETFEEWINNRSYVKNRNEVLRNKFEAQTAYKSWEVNFPEDNDFNSHSTEVLVDELPLGFYVLVASPDKNFKASKAYQYSTIIVSDIAYYSKRTNNNAMQFFVAERTSGEPLKDVKAEVFVQRYDYKKREYITEKKGTFATDKTGNFTVKSSDVNTNNSQFYIVFTKGKDVLNNKDFHMLYNYGAQAERTLTQTYFFTDRAIYRPGQSIHFKGIVIEKKGNENKIKTAYKTTVEFLDVNWQKIASLEVTTNEYGSFSGKFTAPDDRLNGMMHIREQHGTHNVSVEEYKRPNFEVQTNPITGTYKLNENVKVEGFAKTYSGAALDGAEVKYRVQRNGSFPFWCWYRWGFLPSSPNVEITNGVSKTDDKGKFEINFNALADKNVDAKFSPTYAYTVYVDVTDVNGETHSTTATVRVGEKALIISSNLEGSLLKENFEEIAINSTNLNGEFEAANVEVEIWSLEAPKQYYKERKWAAPEKHLITKNDFKKYFPLENYEEEHLVQNWKKQTKIVDKNINTKDEKSISVEKINAFKQGSYFIQLKAKDKYGKDVLEEKYFRIIDSKTKKADPSIFFEVSDIKMTAEPGEKAQFLISTAAENVKVYYEIEKRNGKSRSEWLNLNNEQKLISIPVTEADRGNFTVHLAFIKNNQSYTYTKTVSVPYTNKKLDIEFSTFRDKLLPGQNEEWTVKIKGSKGEKVAAEMLAGMYDASLDAFRTNNWGMNLWNSYYSNVRWETNRNFIATNGNYLINNWNTYAALPYLRYALLNTFGYYYQGGRGGFGYAEMEAVSMTGNKRMMKSMAAAPSGVMADIDGLAIEDVEVDAVMVTEEKESFSNTALNTNQFTIEPPAPKEGFGDIKARTNFNETAFFMPHLVTDADGNINIKFTIPESLTRWKFMALAHSKDLKTGMITKETITQKDLMVYPNAPRFFRENDEMVFSTKIVNLSEKDLNGEAKIIFYDALTNKEIKTGFLKTNASQNFKIEAQKSTSVSWELSIPENYQAITYKVLAKAGNFSDGEEKPVPVLTNRMLVTETLPLPIRGKQSKVFVLDKLKNNKSTTLKNHKLTLEFTSNPAWYAVQALPYLMEYPYDCAEQTFSRFYANAIATHIANSSPKIKEVFKSWENSSPEAFLSNLEKNQELKAVVLEETPWVLQAKNESERKKRVGLLFNLNKMSKEQNKALSRLQNMQKANGAWPWFDGMPESRYITQHVASGMGHLDKLGIKAVREDAKTWQMVQKAVRFLDGEILRDFRNLKKWNSDLKKDNISSIQIQYLYMRSFFLDIPFQNKEAYNYYFGQAKKYWTNKSQYMQAMISLAMHRSNENTTATDIIASIKEYSIENEEMGMYWKQNAGYYWYQAPIETQALFIEAFGEITDDQKSVESMKVWLLKQKQTQDWKTTRATTEACYALLLQGSDWLASEEMVEIKVGNEIIDAKNRPDIKVEAGTGYFKTSWTGEEIKPEMATVSLTKKDKGVSWGGLYWQYFEQLDKITPAKTPLSLEKKLFVVRNTDKGEIIEPITKGDKLKVGDKVRVRVVLRSDRDMEYVHLKDMRASGFEPINVFSGYRYQDGLGYYETTKDASTNFFISWLAKGTYVFEYDLRANIAGNFSNGITSIQCMYAPEFASHSEGIRVEIKE
ncbi:MAG: alpha-2-macroglobulin family protein [Chitinophagales bacterium]